MFRYSTHRSHLSAEKALEDYFASGEVYPSEFAEIRERVSMVNLANGESRIVYDIMLKE